MEIDDRARSDAAAAPNAAQTTLPPEAPRFAGDTGICPLGKEHHFTHGRNPITNLPEKRRKDSWSYALQELSSDKGSSKHYNLETGETFYMAFELTNNKSFAAALRTKHQTIKDHKSTRKHISAAAQKNADAMGHMQAVMSLLGSQQQDLSATSLALGGDGEQPAPQVLPADKNTDCPVCLEEVKPGCKDSTTSSCCGKSFHEHCWTKSITGGNGKCPNCRDVRAPPAAVSTDTGANEPSYDEIVCFSCKRPAPTGERFVCSVEGCAKGICFSCTDLDPAMLNTGKRYCCKKHDRKHGRIGYVRLKKIRYTSDRRASRHIQAATQPAAREERLRARTKKRSKRNSSKASKRKRRTRSR